MKRLITEEDAIKFADDNAPSAVQMKKVEDAIRHPRDEMSMIQKRKSLGGDHWPEGIGDGYPDDPRWDPRPGTDKKWTRSVTSGTLNRLIREAQKKPFIPRGLIRKG